MGSKEILVFLMVSFHFCYPASLFPPVKNLPSAHLQEKAEEIKTDEHKTTIHHDGGNGIAHRSNFAAGVVGSGGVSGGRGGGGNGEESTSTSPNTAGTAVIPLYAASSHHTHRGAASCNRSCIGLSTLFAVILVSLFVHIYVVLDSET